MKASGISEVCYIALCDWFSPNGIMPADTGIMITNSHIFNNGKLGFLPCDIVTQKNSYTHKTIGDFMGKSLSFDLKVVIAGGDIPIHELIAQIINKPAIILVKDLYDSDIIYQIGTKYFPAYITHDYTTGTDISGQKAFAITISCTGNYIQLYNANIKILDPIYPNNGYPVFYSILPMKTSSLSDLSVYYQNAYTYSISKIYNLISTRGLKNVQFVYINDNGEVLQEYPVLDTSTISNFINGLQAELNKLLPTKLLQLYGSKLLAYDTVANEQYLGLSLISDTVIVTEDGQTIMGEDGEEIIGE